MPKFRITSPDGRKFDVTAPDGATQEQVLAYAQQQFSKPKWVDQDAPADPTEGMSTLEKLGAGFGKSAVDTARGIGQLFGVVDQSAVDESRRLDAPLMRTGAGFVGNVGGQIAQMAVPGAVIGKAGLIPKALQGAKLLPAAARAALGAGAFGATQGVGTGESRGGNALESALYGAGGQALASGLGRVAKGASETMSPALRELARKAETYGIPVTASQLSDSSFVKTLRSVVDKLPFGGTGKVNKAQQTAFNRAVARTFGENADEVTADVAARAKARLGSMFESISAKNAVKVDDILLNDLAAVTDDAARTGTVENARIVGNVVDDLLSKTGGNSIPGKAYRELDSKIGRLMKSTQDGDKRHYLGQVREAIRSAMDRSISQADRNVWRTARQQYAALKTVEDLIEKAGTGDLSPALLLGLARKASSDFAYGGGGPLGDLARIGQRFLKSQVPDSGTAQRSAILTALGGGGAFGVIEPMTMLMSLMAGRGASRVLDSKTLAKFMREGSPALARIAQGGKSLPFLLPSAANAVQQQPTQPPRR